MEISLLYNDNISLKIPTKIPQILFLTLKFGVDFADGLFALTPLWPVLQTVK
jgi:hypothetical protein